MSTQMDVDGEPSTAMGEMDDMERYALENECCGICRDIVIDRGVLDCCQHWFCYTCIDHWSAITNRCPLCKKEFQHITCTSVYDHHGAGNEDEYLLTSGDDDWYAQEEGNTLSFPSYYIDAEAVVCLDGGDCMIRSRLVPAENDSTLDTSIACDSCDIWYHAICVGFNPEISSEDSWLCPRCVSTKVKNTTDLILKQNFSEDCVIGSDRATTDASFSGRVSVSVADEGETALVVSMVGLNSGIGDGLLEASLGSITGQETFNCNSYPSNLEDDLSRDALGDANIMRNTDGPCTSQSKSSEINLVRTVSCEPKERSLELSPIRESATTMFTSERGSISNEQLEVPQHVPYSLLQRSKDAEKIGEEIAILGENGERSPVIKSPRLPSADSKTARSTDIDMINADAVQQMKCDQNTQLPSMNDRRNSNAMESENEIDHPAKKAKFGVSDPEMPLIGKSSISSTDCHASSSAAKALVGDISELVGHDKYVPDIMSIVEGDDYRRDLGRELAKPVGRKTGDKPGLRMKKIFRKEERKESVHKLQQEIREVVRDNGVSILERDNGFDEKLLTAFRTAIGKSMDGPAKTTNLSLIRTRRSLLQKGKIRENLTKKLYGTSTGRRRSAWHRDWEVDFWKYRCSPGINPEKIETLQSVLQLLKKSSDTGMDKGSAQNKKGENSNAILSRLYLADASVAPRKDDIKPLSALTECPPLAKNSQIKANTCKATNKPVPGNAAINSPNSTGKVPSSSTLNNEVSSRRESKNGQSTQNQQNQPAGDIKLDKRKWALEILARKNSNTVTSKDQTEGTDDLKGNYPLLAQLPVDMRPQLTTGRHNKVPMSVRQAQLYRIAEHYLQKANLDVIRRCADTELAIIDAVNVEKDIYGKSSSKSVYVNLCSQATRQPAKAKCENDASTLTAKTELGSDLVSQQVTTEIANINSNDAEEALSRAGLFDLPASTGQTEMVELGSASEQPVKEHNIGFSNVEEALKRAGLFDSPPNSPERENTSSEGDSSLKCTVDLDSQPSKSLPSTSDSRVRDVSSLKDDNDSSVHIDLGDANCQQPNYNSEERQKLTPSGETTDATASKAFTENLAESDRYMQCGKSTGPDKDIGNDKPNEGTGHVGSPKEMDKAASDLKESEAVGKPVNPDSTKAKSSSDSRMLNSVHSEGDKSSTHPAESGGNSKKPTPDPASNKTSDSSSSIYKKVEVFVKENIRPLCKSGVITVEQYRWAVAKTADKVMKHHCDATNANFLIKEGEKVKKLALQYVEAAQQKIN